MQESEPFSPGAAAAALETIGQALEDASRTASTEPSAVSDAGPAVSDAGPREALVALTMLREVRERLAGWESGLIEAARAGGASWEDLAAPLGVASRQAAERRYLRLRPGAAGSTGEQRVAATRNSRAAERTVAAWARGNAAELRRLAGQVSALGDLPPGAAASMAKLDQALADNDVARLVGPLRGAREHLRPQDADLTERIDAMTRHTERLRKDSHEQRNPRTT
ncbi:HSP18 transcriptional regulator [Streptomyces sp. Isolate_45]|uniref:HSP18 transcriptional regulator n=1 Tax=Streptomyces sp. Isolate_45 TaxID=2950111 RepID=UPI0024820CF3|nr:HSP18 transcriptional regulator [Streptomyces sp. Isolate_45]MDA5286823.1 HSP18 transcriptional regulator [Streptomyces sp. Isolate_45]